MNREKAAEAIGNIEDRYLEEVFENKGRRSRITAPIRRIAAIAACAALMIGAGAFAVSRHTEVPTETDIPKPQDTTIDVEHPFGGADAEQSSGEEDIELVSYFEIPIDCQGYRYVLKKVEYSKTIPENILKEDIVWRLGFDDDTSRELMKGKASYKHVPGDGTLTIEHLDENGRYSGENEHTWVFATIEITNLSEEAVSHNTFGHYIEYERPGNHHYWWYRRVMILPGEEFPEEVTADDYYHAESFKIPFEPNETRTVIFGYLIESDFIPYSLEICIETEEYEKYTFTAYHPSLPLR